MGKRTAFVPYEHFMLRAPLLPVEFLHSIPGTPDELFPWLSELWKNDLIREGLLLGSYELSQRFERELIRVKPVVPDSDVMHALLRYLCRFSSRCTPFGTFAGFSTGKIEDVTDIRLGMSANHHLHARPDMEYLMGIGRLLGADTQIREKLLFSANTTIYRVGSRWHYVEVTLSEGKSKKVYDIVTVEDGGIVGGILDFCREGRNLQEIRKFLITGGWLEPEVIAYVALLVDSQVIVSGLEPVICGPEYIDCLLSQLGRDFKDHTLVGLLVQLKSVFDLMKQPSMVLANLPLIDPILAVIPVPVNRNHMIQVDMNLSHGSITLDTNICGQILLGLRIMKALAPVRGRDALEGFKKAFLRRYGDRKVALLKVLDPETGIGLEGLVEGYWTDPVPWVDDLRWGPDFRNVPTVDLRGKGWLAGHYHEVVRKGKQYLDLDSSDLKSIDIHDGNWPNQMTAMVELFETELSGETIIHFLLGSSGNPAYLLGRFGYADPDCTFNWISELIEDEKAGSPDVVFAEVVHLPEDRTGNVLQRPSFLDSEIPYLAGSAKPGKDRIPVTDLMVSLQDHQIILSSACTGKRIHPCMTNAYNHQLGSLSVYKFLHRIHLQGIEPGYQPDWGDAAMRASFVPGIRFNNLILAAPEWLVRSEDITKWIDLERNEVDLPSLIVWKNDRQMPDEMLWMSADQELYFSWTNSNLVLALWDAVRSLPVIRIRPFYLSAGTPVKGPDGSHANQFILCFRKP